MTETVTNGDSPATVPLRRWVRRAYIRAILVPLLAVEVVMIAIYLLANHSATGENQRAVESLAEDELRRTAQREALAIDEQLAGIARTAEVFRRQVGLALATPYDPGPEERARYAYADDGRAYYTTHDNGGAAAFYSGIVPVGAEERDKVLRTARLDPLMRDIVHAHPLVVQSYLNTFDSLNRIYPYIDVLAQLPPRMNLPSYNFYYEADAAHNPEREVVWTDAYVDPAGRGWMTSCIAPVYRGEFLEAVVGLDVTVDSIRESVLDLDIPWAGYGVLVGQDGTILALPEAGEDDWKLSELTEYEYTEKIAADRFKPDEFNLFKRPDLSAVARAVGRAGEGIQRLHIGGPRLMAWAEVPQTGWKLLLVVPEANVYAHATQLGERLYRIGGWMIGGLAVFYAIFLLVLDHRSRRMASSISEPLEEEDALVAHIGPGHYAQRAPSFPVAELQRTATGLVDMGAQLGASDQRLREAQREAEHARDQALAASRLKSEFLASVSHEIRTPMNGVLGMLELLAGTELDEEQRDFADSALDSGRALLGIINDILDFSKIEAGKLDISEEHFSLAEVVERGADVLAPRAYEKHLALMTFVDPAAPRVVCGDPGRLRQVLVNLIGNAVKFTDPGGEVSVRAIVEKRVGSGYMLRFAVADTGIGIPEAARERLFQPFTQVDGSSARRHSGTGLGLSICKRLVELMGGEIGADSREGEGSVFWFRVPVKPGDPAQMASGAAADAAAPRAVAGLRVLVVEPGDSARAILADYLRAWQVEVTAVASTGEALAALGDAGQARARGRRAFDCILAGTSPGGGEGAELARALSRDAALRDIPRVLLIEVDGSALAQRARAGGFQRYLSKPIRQAALLACLCEVQAMGREAVAARDRARAAGAAAGAAAPARILLAEDNPINRKVVLRRLHQMGHAVDVAEDGRAAVDMALARHYELILMDVQMPQVDGIEAARAIRTAQAEGSERSAIVAVTASAMEGDRERLLELGMDDYLSKPFEPWQLEQLVHRWVQQAPS